MGTGYLRTGYLSHRYGTGSPYAFWQRRHSVDSVSQGILCDGIQEKSHGPTILPPEVSLTPILLKRMKSVSSVSLY